MAGREPFRTIGRATYAFSRSSRVGDPDLYFSPHEKYGPLIAVNFRLRPRTFAGTLVETQTMEPIALSVSDAVKASGLGRTTLYEAMSEGRMETRKVGRKRLILTRSLRRLIEGEV